MNLFRSEEHIRKWSTFESGTEEGIVELSALAKVFSGNFFTRQFETGLCFQLSEVHRRIFIYRHRDRESPPVLVAKGSVAIPDKFSQSRAGHFDLPFP